MRHRLRLLLPLLALTALACESPLSPGTAGPPVFAAEIDHRRWPPADSPAVFTATLVDPGTLTIAAAIKDRSGSAIQLLGMSIPDFHGAGRYRLSESASTPWALLRRPGIDGTAIYISGKSTDDFIHITAIDTLAQVIAGTFAFTVHPSGREAAPIEVRRGAFRVPYTTSAPSDQATPTLRTLLSVPPVIDPPAFPVSYH